MTDIRTTWNPLLNTGDWAIAPPAPQGRGGLADGADLETSVLISLFTDARAADDDRLPGADHDRRGWWAAPLGSRLWLLAREKATNEVRLRAEDYCREALAWMLTDRVADEIDVAASWAPPPAELGQLFIEVAIYRRGTALFTRRFDWAWTPPRVLPPPPPPVKWDGGTTDWDNETTVWPR